ncbi:MAG: hypothetical protein IRZ16_21730 [Myxococcaceae bacterium]|nr:hypothetical protein [Myxococcaceae bacterium]
MSLLPESASFEEMVQDCFLAHRGAGLMLSPLDVELVMAWSADGIPFEVVARGIRKAAERALWDARPGEPALRSLRACRREVDQEIRKYRARSAGAHSGQSSGANGQKPRRSFEEERFRKLRAALTKLGREDPRVSEATARLLQTVLLAPTSDLAEADRREHVVLAVLLRALPFAERLALYKEASALCGDPRLQSAHARRMSRRFHRNALTRRALALPGFW